MNIGSFVLTYLVAPVIFYFVSFNCWFAGKNYGFVKFACAESADKAQKYMHGETISGNHLKCLDAEDPPPDSKKSRKQTASV